VRRRASEQEKRGVRDRKKERERDPPRRAGEPCCEEGRKKDKELWRERERGVLRLERQRQSTQERERDREYSVTRNTHISTNDKRLPHASPYPSTFNTITRVHLWKTKNIFWVGDSCRGNMPLVSHIIKYTAAGTSLSCIFIN